MRFAGKILSWYLESKMETKYNLMFVKPGDHVQFVEHKDLSQIMAFELIRDRVGMGWTLVQITTIR